MWDLITLKKLNANAEAQETARDTARTWTERTGSSANMILIGESGLGNREKLIRQLEECHPLVVLNAKVSISAHSETEKRL